MATAPVRAFAEQVVTRFRVTRVVGASMYDWMKMLMSEKRTGALTVNFSQGTPCSIEFKEKEK